MRNRFVYRKRGDKLLFYVPSAMKQEIMYKYYNKFGHFGVDKTHAVLQKNYWFPNMKEKIQIYIRNCIKGIFFSKLSGKTKEFVHSIPKGTV